MTTMFNEDFTIEVILMDRKTNRERELETEREQTGTKRKV